MDNLTIQTQSQSVSHLAETQAKFKGMHADRIILMRSKDWYVTANEDAATVSETLGITLTKTKQGEKQAGFPHTALDIYLPKLIRAGHRVAIADLI